MRENITETTSEDNLTLNWYPSNFFFHNIFSILLIPKRRVNFYEDFT